LSHEHTFYRADVRTPGLHDPQVRIEVRRANRCIISLEHFYGDSPLQEFDELDGVLEVQTGSLNGVENIIGKIQVQFAFAVHRIVAGDLEDTTAFLLRRVPCYKCAQSSDMVLMF